MGLPVPAIHLYRNKPMGATRANEIRDEFEREAGMPCVLRKNSNGFDVTIPAEHLEEWLVRENRIARMAR